MRPSRTRWGFAIAAGLAWLLPASAAHAQFSYGYDSFVYYPPAQSAYSASGYQAAYTDPSTGAFFNNEVITNRTVAPYVNPPYGTFRQGNGLPMVTTARPLVPAPAPVRQPVVKKRRILIRRPAR